MNARYHTLDVFTDRIFGGNPLAVFPEATGIPDALLAPIARELNLSETVFVYPPTSPTGSRRVRIFTPGGEVPFAGHPTVGTAWLLVASGAVAATPDAEAHPSVEASAVEVVLEEEVGPVSVEVTLHAGRPRMARLTTAAAHREWPFPAGAEGAAAIVGLEPEEIGWDNPPHRPIFASAGLPFLIVPVRDADALGRARLDEAARGRVLGPTPPATMVYLVAPAPESGTGSDADLRARMFAPEIGVPEDPATGSACAALGGYLGARLGVAQGAEAWRVDQGVEMGRPSRLHLDVEVSGGGPTRVRVGGSCVQVARGEMTLPKR